MARQLIELERVLADWPSAREFRAKEMKNALSHLSQRQSPVLSKSYESLDLLGESKTKIEDQRGLASSIDENIISTTGTTHEISTNVSKFRADVVEASGEITAINNLASGIRSRIVQVLEQVQV